MSIIFSANIFFLFLHASQIFVMKKYKILCIGNQWRGSNDGSLFNAFSRLGHIIHIVDHKMYLPSDAIGFFSKVISKTFRKVFIDDFNDEIIKQATKIVNPQLVCVFKGNGIYPDTLLKIKQQGIPIFCVYPDVSFFDYGPNIPKLVPYYDYIFTTKSFGAQDLKETLNYRNVSVINHSIDPLIHRKIDLEPKEFSHLINDVSFIGSHSEKKDEIMRNVIEFLGDKNIKIWGGSWSNSKYKSVKQRCIKSVIFGDLYSVAIQKSKINLGLLYEGSKTSYSGDLITSRTFHIPGAGGFMIHERTEEVLEIFKEGDSVECYESAEELIDKIKYYLSHENLRQKIADKGHEIVWKFHKSDDRAKEMIDKLKVCKII